MKNIERWKNYFRHIHAPKQFVEAGFYFCISAALERRAWVSAGAHKIFANQYVLLVGPGGVGKGLVTGVCDEVVLRHWKKVNTDDEPIIRMGPTSGSYQKLIERMAKGTELCKYIEDGKERHYPYSSACCMLDEFTSLFTEHAKEAVAFFCSAWTGSVPYERDTNSRGRLYIKNPNISILAGTTPRNLSGLVKSDIIGSGLERRLLIVYAHENEWRQHEIPPIQPDQQRDMDQILEHIRDLSLVCGGLKYSPEANRYFADWWADRSRCEVAHHPTLETYHPSKNSLVHKLCIAVHMSEGSPAKQLQTPISVESITEAIRMLLSYEQFRHCAWRESAQNMKYTTAMRIATWLKQRPPVPYNEVKDNFYAEADDQALGEILSYLVQSGRAIITIDQRGQMYGATDKE